MTDSWDGNLDWDATGFYDNTYHSLITSEYQNKPLFRKVISALLQPFVDMQNNLNNIPYQYDVDEAVGEQLDVVGQWVGISRDLAVPLTGVYFSLDTDGLGFDQGTWLGPFDPTTELDVLPDDAYRQIIYTKIANNQWDGTVPGAYKFMDAVFPNQVFFIQDNQDMSIIIGVQNNNLDAVSYALLSGGYFDIKPAGVRVNGYAVPSVSNAAFFGFDVENSLVSGFDVGCFATLSGGN